MATRDLHMEEDEILFKPIESSGKNFYLTASILGVLVILGVIAYIYQYRNGLAVTGLSRQVFWGVYITNFVFFIGISHAGTLISAILRIVKAEWRLPVTRAAELITVLVLLFGVGSIIIDLGRPDRMFNLVRHAQFGSPLLWDVTSVAIYFTASSFFLYIALIPDIALLRDRGNSPKWLYQILSAGFTGTAKQLRVLDILILIMAIAVIPIAVSVHTVVSFVFAMTIQPMWHSAIFGPYFVVGAIFSGVAALIIAMYLIRKFYNLGDYLKHKQFNNLGLLLLVMACFWFYFTLAEYLTTFYGNEPAQMTVFWSKFTGEFAPLFWAMFIFCFVIPFPILAINRTRTILGTTIASISVVIGMWLERYVIVVPTLTAQRLASDLPTYMPTWVEWSILAGSAAFFCLLYVLFSKFFPIIAIWEIREDREKKREEIIEYVRERLPEKGEELEEVLPE
ncbi:MAG: polysulfide reductase NrfD [Chloroflexi bacterium]|nr:polysulfide reductase NrfD [Chloroflexota bacterium]